MRIGIDATSLGLGGGVTHLKEILISLDQFRLENYPSIIIFSSKKILDQLQMLEIIQIMILLMNLLQLLNQ